MNPRGDEGPHSRQRTVVADAAQPASLKRALTLPVLTFYGLGSIIGAGIYALIGEVAGYAGLQAPAAFLLAAFIAAFSGLSYAELSARFPKSGGEAVYVEQAFNRRALTAATGWAVVFTGVVSAATIANAFSGYLRVFFDIPAVWAIVLFILVIAGIAIWGIAESALLAAAMTLLSIAGLLIVLVAAGDAWAQLPEIWPHMVPRDSAALMGVALGAFLAFYAFIGFEDMVNVAEEVVNPQRNLPLAIILALLMATLLYGAVAVVAVLALPLDELVASDAPLADILAKDGRVSPALISSISLVALTNSALAQLIMAARVVFGLVEQGLAPRCLGQLSRRTRTPVVATLVITVTIVVFALWLPMRTLAELTSVVILVIFTLINVALLVVRTGQRVPDMGIRMPLFVPACGALLCGAFIVLRLVG